MINTDDYEEHTLDGLTPELLVESGFEAANAKLIAAAPDLLAEVKKLQAWKKFVCDLVKQQDGSYLREMLKEMIE